MIIYMALQRLNVYDVTKYNDAMLTFRVVVVA